MINSKTAIVGTGIVSSSHIKSIKKLGKSNLFCLIDTNKKILKQKSNYWGINQISDDVDYLTEVAKPDIVHICTPPQYHSDLISNLCSKEINLFVEKPFVLSLEELDKIRKVKGSSIIHCNHNYTFKSCIVKLYNVVNEIKVRPRQIKALYSIKTDNGIYNQKGDNLHWSYDIPSGPIINNISHPLSIISLFGGRFNNFTTSQKIDGGLDSWSISIESDTCHSSCSMFMSKKNFTKIIDFVFDDFSVRCDLHRDTAYFYNVRGSVLKDYFSDSLKNIVYSVRDLFVSLPRLYQSFTRKMPDIDRSLLFFYESIEKNKTSKINDSQIEDSTKIIDSIINQSEYILENL